MKKNSIPQLVELSQKGDSNAFELLFTTFKTRLHHSLFRILRNYHETEDIVQQAFLRAWEKIGTFKGNSNFYTWLYRIGFNLAITKINSSRENQIDEGEVIFTEPIADFDGDGISDNACLLYTSPSPRDRQKSRMPSSA